MVVHNGLNYDHPCIIKEPAKEFEGEFNCLGENIEKYKTFSVPITKGIKRINKNEAKKAYLTNYNLLIAHDSWQAHHQILLIILLKKFINLNANMEMITKNVKRVELNTKIYVAIEITEDSLMKT